MCAKQSGKYVSSIFDKSFQKPLKYEFPYSSYAFLFSEIVQYCYKKNMASAQGLNTSLHALGYGVGERYIELHYNRERSFKREIKVINFLIVIKSTFWKLLFGKEADKLEQAIDDANTYYLVEKEDSFVNRFISVPKDKTDINCANFVAGIVEAMMCASNFAANVSAHRHNETTTYVIKLKTPITRATDGKDSSSLV